MHCNLPRPEPHTPTTLPFSSLENDIIFMVMEWESGKEQERTGVWTLLTPGTLSVLFYLIQFLLNPSISQPKVIFLWQSILFRCSQTSADRVGEEGRERESVRGGWWIGDSLEPDTLLQSFHLGLVILHWVNKWQVLPYVVCKPHRRGW